MRDNFSALKRSGGVLIQVDMGLTIEEGKSRSIGAYCSRIHAGTGVAENEIAREGD